MGDKKEKKESRSSINPIYTKYARSIIRALSDTAFYEYFMKMIATGNNEFSFSNRKKKTIVDVEWVDQIDAALAPLQTIISNSRNVIKEEEIIVNVAHAKKNTPDTVRHLAQHGSLVQDYDEDNNEVRPDRLMQKLREESIDIYENRLVFTTLELAYNFTKMRHDAIMGGMGDEFGAKLKMHSSLENERELVDIDMFLHIKEKDDFLMTDSKNESIFSRISRIYRVLAAFMSTTFAQTMQKSNRVKGTVVKTNVLKKNPNYKVIVKLYEFLHNYDKIGYTILIDEQSPEIKKGLEQDIYHNIMMQYIVLKNYLRDEEDRTIPALKQKKKTLKPKFIHQIIEELTDNYDLPNVEIRRVLIEELTREQLLEVSEEERQKIIAETERVRKAEEAKRLQAQHEEEERRRREQEILEERRRQEEQALEVAKEAARILQANEDARIKKLLAAELNYFSSKVQAKLDSRVAQQERRNAALARMTTEEARAIRRHLAMLDEREAQKAYSQLTEQQRQAIARIEEEQRRRETERLEREAEKLLKEQQLDQEAQENLAPYLDCVYSFNASLPYRKSLREKYKNERRKLLAERNARIAEKRKNKVLGGEVK